jgi:hypothetical protein
MKDTNGDVFKVLLIEAVSKRWLLPSRPMQPKPPSPQSPGLLMLAITVYSSPKTQCLSLGILYSEDVSKRRRQIDDAVAELLEASKELKTTQVAGPAPRGPQPWAPPRQALQPSRQGTRAIEDRAAEAQLAVPLPAWVARHSAGEVVAPPRKPGHRQSLAAATF